MKNVCMYVVITMLFASAAFSAEPTVDFDQGSAQPVGMMSVVDNVYVNPQLAVRNNAMITPATKLQGSSAILPPMKEVLKDVPSEDRAEFLNSLALRNGHIVYAYIAPLKRTLSKKRVSEILDAIFVHSNADEAASSENNGASVMFVQMSTLLKEVPTDIKNEFLDNMAFKNGSFASAYIGGLSKVLKDAKLKEMLYSMTPKGDNPKTLCGDDICYWTGCFGERCLTSVTNTVCTSACSDATFP